MSRSLQVILLATLPVMFFTPAHSSEGVDSLPRLSFFPAKKIFPLFTADGLAHQLSLSRVTENREWIGAVGGSVPMLQLDLDKTNIQASVAVTIFNRLIKTPRHLTVYTIDYKVDFPIDFRFGDWSLQTGLGHISCHFADDALELLGKHSIQHVNDYFTVAAGRNIDAIRGYVYGGFNYSYGTQPIQFRPWLLQFGATFGNIPLHEEVTLYGAFDIKVKQEVGWGSIQSYQIGCRVLPRSHTSLRVAYTFRTGFDDRGQFYLTKTTLNLISAFLDF